MLFADIRVITAPSEAEAGQRVDIRVSIKNLHNDYMRILVAGALEYGISPWPLITFPSDTATFGPWQYYYFEGYFIMPYYPPGKVIKIHAYSYWYGDDGSGYDAWHFDDEMVKEVITVVEPPPVEPLPTWNLMSTYSIVIVPTVVTWKLLDSSYMSITPVVAEWKKLSSYNLTIEPEVVTPEPPECFIDADCLPGYVCRNGICVLEIEPPIDEEGVGMIVPLLIGGGILVAALAKTDRRTKKIKSKKPRKQGIKP